MSGKDHLRMSIDLDFCNLDAAKRTLATIEEFERILRRCAVGARKDIQRLGGPASFPRLIRQQDAYGCVVACLAMISGLTYEAVRAELGFDGKGFTYHVWQDFLVRRGFAVQHVWKTDQRTNAPRDPWPLRPWADLHLCAIDAGQGPGSHQVICLRDGTVLDPMREEPARFSDCQGVVYMAALFDVGAPCPTPSLCREGT